MPSLLPRKLKIWYLVGVAILLSLLGVHGSASPQLTASMAPETAFEVAAGVMGRADAWFVMHEDVLRGSEPTDDALSAVTQEIASTSQLTSAVYLPVVMGRHGEGEVPVERRAIWITRYDWALVTPQPEAIDTMVAKIAGAGFNTIYFQVRGAGDAYYTPGLEPWSARLTAGPVSETLGVDPGWDPLERMIDRGHAAGLEVHAYVNVYPAWLSPPAGQGELWPPATEPMQMFDRFTYGPQNQEHPGVYALGYDWRQHHVSQDPMPLAPGQYLWASPGVPLVADHVVAVIEDIAARYAIDGIHLDRVRYAGRDYSYDPFSNTAEGTIPTPERDQWQRDQVTALVRRVTATVKAVRPEAEVSAAVWPWYQNRWEWKVSEGYSDFYQDSHGWIREGALDAIIPMLYGSDFGASDSYEGDPDDIAWWQILMEDFMAVDTGGSVYPGIGGDYEDFAQIAERIALGRQAGAQGHVLFSYSSLDARDYWDDLAGGPYLVPARAPSQDSTSGEAP